MRNFVAGIVANLSVGLIVGSTIAVLIEEKISLGSGVVFAWGAFLAGVAIVIKMRK